MFACLNNDTSGKAKENMVFNVLKVKCLIVFLFCLQKISLSQIVADFSASSTVICVGQSVQFTNLSSSNVVSWVWDFGDGNSSFLQNPVHSYLNAGTYTVILTVSNGMVSVDEEKVNFILVNPLPEPTFSTTSPPCVLPAAISILNTQPSGNYTYFWEFGNGQTSNLQNPSNINYNEENEFNISLTVTNALTGCNTTVNQNINIYEFYTSLSYDTNVICVGGTINFTQNSSAGANSFYWQFGNGSQSFATNPNVVYNTPGTYTVTLTSTNSSNGCSATASTEITVLPAQTPSLSPSLTVGCNPQEITFTNTSGFDGAYFWDFGNGQTFEGTNPPVIEYSMLPWNSNTMPLVSSFTVVLSSVDNNGCASSVVFEDLISLFNVFPLFQPSVTSGCEPLEVDFTNTSYTGNSNFPPAEWSWDFNDGNTSNLESPNNVFYHGIYNITYTVTTANGCSESTTTTITAGIEPQAYFTFDEDTICAKGTVDFTNLSTVNVNPQLDNLSFSWALPGGVSTNFEPDNVPMYGIGSQLIMLTANYLGCPNVFTSPDSLFLNGPLTNFGTPTIYCNPEIPFDAVISNYTQYGMPGDSVEVIWSFGDNSSTIWDNEDAWDNTYGSTFTHQLNSFGDYDIQQITINHSSGCTDSLTLTIKLFEFVVNVSVLEDSLCLGDSVFFQADVYTNIPTSVINYEYTLENTSLEVDLPAYNNYNNTYSYLYTTPGLQYIEFAAQQNYMCWASTTAPILIGSPPEFNILPSIVAGCDSLEVAYVFDQNSYEGLPIENYLWSISDSAFNNNNSYLNTTLFGAGEHEVNLQVTDMIGCVGEASVSTFITEPTAAFNFPNYICNATPVVAVNTSDNYISSEWYIDATSLTSSTHATVYTSIAIDNDILDYNYDLTLVVLDSNGCEASYTQPFTVSTPNANFSWAFSGSNINENGEFTCPSVFSALTDLSSSIGSITSWSWSFGDGKYSNLQNPNNTYIHAGTYTCVLVITDEYGCTDSAQYENYLTIGGPSGVFDWIHTGANPCESAFTFNSDSLNDVHTMLWHMGNGVTFSNVSTFHYNYPGSGSYYPFVIITDDNGCEMHHYLDTVTVYDGELNASFWATPETINWGEPLLIVNESTGGIGGITSNQWYISDTSFFNSQAQFNQFLNSTGETTLMLVVTDSMGCVDTAYFTVYETNNLSFPNVFTPNSDNSNDVLRIIDNAYKEYEVVILNRWGNEMSKSYIINDNYLWDGRTQRGELASEGVYFYSVKGLLRDGKAREDHGFFHLVRE